MKFTPHHNEKGELICLVSHKRYKRIWWYMAGCLGLFYFGLWLLRFSELASFLTMTGALIASSVGAYLLYEETRCPLCAQTIHGIFHYGSIESTQHCPYCHATLEFID